MAHVEESTDHSGGRMDDDRVPGGTVNGEATTRRQEGRELPRSAAAVVDALEAVSAPTSTRKRGRPRLEPAPSPPKKKRGRPRRGLLAQEVLVAPSQSSLSDDNDDTGAMARRPTLTIPLKPQYGYLATHQRRQATSPNEDRLLQPSEKALEAKPAERRYPVRARAATALAVTLPDAAAGVPRQSKKAQGRPPRKQPIPTYEPSVESDDAEAPPAGSPRDEPSSASHARGEPDALRFAALEKRLRDLDRYNTYLESRIAELEEQVAAATSGPIRRLSGRNTSLATPQPASATYVPPSNVAQEPSLRSSQPAQTPPSVEPALATVVPPATGPSPTSLGVSGSRLMPADLLPWLKLPPNMSVSAGFLMEATADLVKPWSVVMHILPEATCQARLEALPRMLAFVVDGESFALPTSALLEHEASYFYAVVLHQPYAIDKAGAAVFALQVHLPPALFGRVIKYLLYKHLDTRDLSATNITLLHCTLKFWCIKWFERSPTLFSFDATLSSAKIALLENAKAASLPYEGDYDFEWAFGANAVTRFSVLLGDIGDVLVGLGPREPHAEPGNFPGWFIHVQASEKAYVLHKAKSFAYMEKRPVTFERGDILTVLLDRDTLWLRFFRNQMELDVAFRLEARHVQQPLFPSIGLRPCVDKLGTRHGCHVAFYG